MGRFTGRGEEGGGMVTRRHDVAKGGGTMLSSVDGGCMVGDAARRDMLKLICSAQSMAHGHVIIWTHLHLAERLRIPVFSTQSYLGDLIIGNLIYTIIKYYHPYHHLSDMFRWCQRPWGSGFQFSQLSCI